MSPIARHNLFGATFLGTLAALPFPAGMGQEPAAAPPAAYSVGYLGPRGWEASTGR